MKKVVAVILTLVMLMSVPVGALAEMGETPEEGTTTVESPTEPKGSEETPTEEPEEEPGEGEGIVGIVCIDRNSKEEIRDEEIRILPYGNYEIDAPEIKGYELFGENKKIATISEDRKEYFVEFWYVKIKKVGEVKVYVDLEGVKSLFETKNYLIGENEIIAPPIDGYSVLEPIQKINVELGGKHEVTFVYKGLQKPVDPEEIESYVNITCKTEQGEWLKEVIQELELGEHSIAPPEIEGYEAVSRESKTITLTEENPTIEISFDYKKIETEEPVKETALVSVYKVVEGQKVLVSEIEMELGEQVIDAPIVDGYTPDKEDVKIDLTSDKEVVFTYTKSEEEPEEPVKDLGKVEITYQTKDGEEVSPKETKEQEVGTKVTYEAKPVKGYINKGEKAIEVEITEKDQVVPVVFTYEAEAPTKDYGVVEVTYKDDKGKEISSKQEFKQEVGKTEVYKAKTIKGYDRVGDKEKKVKITKKNEVVKIEFKYEEDKKDVDTGGSSGGSSGGGGGGSSRRDKDKDKEEKEEKEIKVDKNVKEIDEKRETIRKEMKNQIVGLESDNFVVVNLEDIKQQNSGSFTLNTKKVDSYEKSGLKHRYYKWIPNKEIWVGMGTKVNNGVITSTETLKSGEKVRLLAVKAPKFQDVKANDWYEEELDKALAFGVVEGFKESNGDTTFQASKTLTNAEFCTMAARLFGATENEDGRVFKDLPVIKETKGNTWFAPYTKALQDVGVLNKGMTEGQFNGGITRIDAVRLLTKLSKKHGVKTVDIGTKFGDMEDANEEVLDILKGNPDGTFKPNNGLTRAEAVAMISRTLKELGL